MDDVDIQRVRLDMSMSSKDITNLVKFAVGHGFTREKPIERWNEWDKKEAVRFALSNVLRSILLDI